jgi:hypothetical protein
VKERSPKWPKSTLFYEVFNGVVRRYGRVREMEIGLASGLPSRDLLLERHVVSAESVLKRVAEAETTIASN